MLTILAVSDQKEESLLRLLENRSEEIRRTVDIVISCGDLTAAYVELIASLTNKIVHYVLGNHHFEERSPDAREEPKRMSGIFSPGHDVPEALDDAQRNIPGGINIHRTTIAEERFRLTGFEGSAWYNGEDKQYTESEMSRAVRAVSRTLEFSSLGARMLGKKEPPLIAVSHAPIADVGDGRDRTHRGFKCFHPFIRRRNPALWLHGHIHLDHYSKNAVFRVGETTVVNCFGYKFIRLNDDGTVRSTFDLNGIG
ncbi:MAG: metallophosphoesterase [Spirochaetota bacterium]